MNSLLDQMKDLLWEQLSALASFGWAVGWAAAQNFFDKLSAPAIAGPGKADILRYGLDIMQAGDPKGACKAAAEGIYNLLLPNFGDVMRGPVGAVTDMIGTGDAIGGSVGTRGDSGSSPYQATPGSSQIGGKGLNDILRPEDEANEDHG